MAILFYIFYIFTINIQILGEEGKVTESMKLLQDVENKKTLKTEKEVSVIHRSLNQLNFVKFI